MKTKGYSIFRISIISISVIGFISFLYVGAWYMSSGSYSRAERYELNIPEDSLIKKIEDFKKLNPQYQVPKSTIFLDERERYYYHIYLYYPKEKRIVHTWTRGNKHVSTLAFVATWSINTRNEDYKEVNGNFWWWKNRSDKLIFEERIFNKLGLQRK